MNLLYLGVKLAIYGCVTLFAPIAFQLLILYYLSYFLQKLISNVFGFSRAVYFTAPGTIIHELSHFLACMFTGTPVGELHLFNPREDPPGSGRWVLGEVVRGRTSYVADLFISIAPFFGCTCILILAVKVLLPGFSIPPFPYETLAEMKLYTIADAVLFLLTYIFTYIDYLGDFIVSLNWLDLRTYLFLIITLTISPGIAPSTTDFRQFFSALGVIGLFLIPLAILFHVIGVPIISLTKMQMGNLLIELSTYLGMSTLICLGGCSFFLIADGALSLMKGEETR